MSWVLNRIKDVSKTNQLSLSNNTEDDYLFKYIDIGNVSQNGIIEEPEWITFKDSPSRARRIVKQNDVIISTVRTYLKAITYFDDEIKDIIVSTGFAVLTPKRNINFKFLAYKVLSESFVTSIILNSKGVSYPAINASELECLELLIPPLNEQTQIANYLDKKTNGIDRKIELLTKKISTYKELRKSLIKETALKGLDKDVKLIDSKISWLGSYPAHWQLKRIKDIFTISRGRVIAKTELKNNGLYPVYSSQTQNNGELGCINTYDFDTDLLTWTTDGANAGTVFKRAGKFSCTNICGTLIPIYKDKISLDYFVYSVQESATPNKRIDTNGAKIMSNEMSIIDIVVPPLEEQKAIANYLDEKTSKIDAIVNNIENQITHLKELRKALINDVVTGKIKVIENE